MHSGPVYQIVTNYMGEHTLEDMFKWLPSMVYDTRFNDQNFPSKFLAGPYVEVGRLVRYTHDVDADDVQRSFASQGWRSASPAELLAFTGIYREDVRIPCGTQIIALGSVWQGLVPIATKHIRDDRDFGWNIDLIDVSNVFERDTVFLAIHDK